MGPGGIGGDDRFPPETVVTREPGEVRLRITAGGLLTVTVEDHPYEAASAAEAFPRTDPGHWLVLYDRDGQELCVLEDEDRLDAASKDALLRYLKLHDRAPRVTEVHRVRNERGRWHLSVQTDRGPMELLLPNLHEHVENMGPDRVLVRDMDGRACEIRDWRRMDRKSRKQLAKLF